MKYGEIIEIGRHRLMCGDATRREDVFALIGNDNVNLVLTDPPYGIRSVARKTGHFPKCRKTYRECIGDVNGDMARESYHIL